MLPVPGSDDHFWVRGTETIYLVDAGSYERRRLPSCECLAGQYRRQCAHLVAVSRYLREWPLCPVCKGLGHFFPNGSVRYVNATTGVVDLSPIPLTCCMGAGTRKAWEEAGCFPAEGG